jgi:hypothetical protein
MTIIEAAQKSQSDAAPEPPVVVEASAPAANRPNAPKPSQLFKSGVAHEGAVVARKVGLNVTPVPVLDLSTPMGVLYTYLVEESFGPGGLKKLVAFALINRLRTSLDQSREKQAGELRQLQKQLAGAEHSQTPLERGLVTSQLLELAEAESGTSRELSALCYQLERADELTAPGAEDALLIRAQFTLHSDEVAKVLKVTLPKANAKGGINRKQPSDDTPVAKPSGPKPSRKRRPRGGAASKPAVKSESKATPDPAVTDEVVEGVVQAVTKVADKVTGKGNGEAKAKPEVKAPAPKTESKKPAIPPPAPPRPASTEQLAALAKLEEDLKAKTGLKSDYARRARRVLDEIKRGGSYVPLDAPRYFTGEQATRLLGEGQFLVNYVPPVREPKEVSAPAPVVEASWADPSILPKGSKGNQQGPSATRVTRGGAIDGGPNSPKAKRKKSGR